MCSNPENQNNQENQTFLRIEARAIGASKLGQQQKLSVAQSEANTVPRSLYGFNSEGQMQTEREFAQVNLVLDKHAFASPLLKQHLKRHLRLKEYSTIRMKTHSCNEAEKP
jgi:hypothetical protein